MQNLSALYRRLNPSLIVSYDNAATIENTVGETVRTPNHQAFDPAKQTDIRPDASLSPPTFEHDCGYGSVIGSDEAFPSFFDDTENNCCNEAQAQTQGHCMSHCSHRICKRNSRGFPPCDRPSWECRKAEGINHVPQAVEPRMLLEELDETDLQGARILRDTENQSQIIEISFTGAKTYLTIAEELGWLNLRSFVRNSKHPFPPSALYDATKHEEATEHANNMHQKFHTYLSTSLAKLPHQKRTIKMQEFRREMQAYMRLEGIVWIATWCLDPQIKPEDQVAYVLEGLKRGTLLPEVNIFLDHVMAMTNEVVTWMVWAR